MSRSGIAKTSIDDVAKEAGVSRATVYRHFKGGKEQLERAVIAWEVGRFFGRLGEAVQGATTLHDILVESLLAAHRIVEEHVVLHRLLSSEPEVLVPRLTSEANQFQPVVRDFLLPYVGAEAVHRRLREGVEPQYAADFLARMVLTHTNAQGRWDLTDRDEVKKLVSMLLSGVISPAL